jgi:protein phosphatase
LNTAIYSSSATGARTDNQDRAWAAENGLLVVADGMGGLQSGGEAAEIALRVARQLTGAAAPREALVRAFQQANREIWEYGEQHDLAGGIGSTLVVCLALEGRYLVANVGDSRGYYINNSAAWQITEDHSRAQEMVRVGAMTAEAAQRSPFRNELTNCLGEPNGIPLDIFPRGNLWGIIDEDCVLLLCSDGLHGWVTDAEIHRTLLAERHLAAGCDALIDLALKNGSTDNVSIAAAEFGRLARRKRGWRWFGR